MQAIRTAFQPVVEGCRLQILLACHTKLVKPSLSSKQTLNGDLVKKLFRQKSIYVRPDKVILCEDNESLKFPQPFALLTHSPCLLMMRSSGASLPKMFVLLSLPSLLTPSQCPPILLSLLLMRMSLTPVEHLPHTSALSVGSSASVTGDTRVFSSNTSSVSNGPTQPSLSSTSYSMSSILFSFSY
ncbi:uncharacterized protein LOC106632444, partial [Haplochromis burtoni]|uniref:uncharacterized protein LOC106632444 n=1 Tax=Haplochromis burtoni TaxID=8153 RepID=UPI001C2D975F